MTSKLPRFNFGEIEAVVFSGGGSRCLWQAGIWDTISQRNEFKPKVIAAASAGATIACLILCGKSKEGLEYFKKATDKNLKNAYWSNIFKSEPVFPHYGIYRKAIFDLIDSDALKRLKKGPEIRIQISHPPRWLGPRSGAFVGIAAYSIEKLLTYPMHPTYSTRLGFTSTTVSVSECETVAELADLLLQSSCTPPFVPVMMRNTKPALDGGLVDNVPIKILNDVSGKKLILLSRQYPDDKIPQIPERIYIQPSKSVTISKWDYTNPEGLQFAYDLGKKDAETLQGNS